jgi:oligopeptide transport system substrate-binding protein
MKQKATAEKNARMGVAPVGNFSQKETKTTKVKASGAASPLDESRWDWLSPLLTPFSPSSFPSFPSFASVKTLFVLLFTATALCTAEATRRPKILRLASIVDLQSLDPAKQVMSFESMVGRLVHLPLLDVTNGPTGPTLTPCAARAWSASPDQRVFTLQLRTDVVFSNGRSVVANDYVYALERILNPDTGSMFQIRFFCIRGAKAFAAHETNHVAGLRAPSADTLVVELERSDPVFLYQFGFPIAAVPREEVERLGIGFSVRPVGSGPYMVQEWTRGARLRLTRNPHYHGPEPQHLDGVDLFIGGDETTHLMMFERGELDVTGIPMPSFRRLSNDSRWQRLIERAPLPGTLGLIMNTEIPPLDNVLVRRAISHAVNRDLRMRVAQGFHTHAEGILPPVMPGYNPRLRGNDYNPEKARELLRESDLPLPLRTMLWHSPDEIVRTAAQGFQWDLKQVGIEVDLKQVSSAVLAASESIRGMVPMALDGWTTGTPDPNEILTMNFDGRTITNAMTMNVAYYNNPAFDRLLDLAAPEADLPKRYALYQQAEELLVNDAPWVFLGHFNLFALRQPWLKGPLIALSGLRPDRVWIEE